MNSINYAGARPDSKSGCSDSMFEQTDPTKLSTLSLSDDATQGWYLGK